jgi:hypothetical protein
MLRAGNFSGSISINSAYIFSLSGEKWVNYPFLILGGEICDVNRINSLEARLI